MEEGKAGMESSINSMTWIATPESFLLLATKNKTLQITNNIVVTSILMVSFWLDPAKCPFSRIK